jgi:hypothetical protein
LLAFANFKFQGHNQIWFQCGLKANLNFKKLINLSTPLWEVAAPHSNSRLDHKNLSRIKHSSLFCRSIGDKE